MIIMSGGQTGADRAGLDAAIELNIKYCGYCPKGRLAEDGPIDEKYKLTETDSSGYSKRTFYNAFFSDATLIFINKIFTAGSKLTERICVTENKLYTIIDFNTIIHFDLKMWMSNNGIEILNIAGSRESSSPGIYKLTKDFLINNLGE